MINEKYHAPDGRGLKLKLPVPANAKPGVPILVGEMLVIPTTVRATPELRKARVMLPQGLRDGEASCFIPGLGSLLSTGVGTDLGPLPEGISVGAKVYRDNDGPLSATGTLHIGYVIPLPEPERGLGVGVRGN